MADLFSLSTLGPRAVAKNGISVLQDRVAILQNARNKDLDSMNGRVQASGCGEGINRSRMMNVAFRNAEGIVVSATSVGDRIHVESPSCSGLLTVRQSERLRRALDRIDSFEGTADYIDAEKAILKHYEIARFML